jgi:hypothetical protein
VAAGLDHRHLAGPVDAARGADAAIETDEIGAAAEEHVLAVVNDFAHAGMKIRTGAPAQVAASLDEPHGESGIGEGAGRAHAGHAASNHGDGLRCALLRAGHNQSFGAEADIIPACQCTCRSLSPPKRSR